MPSNGKSPAWSPDEIAALAMWGAEERSNIALATRLNDRYHRGVKVRNANSVSVKRANLGIKAPAMATASTDPTAEQRVEREESDSGVTLRSVGQRIKTVDELLAHAAIDLTRYEVARQKANTWDTTLRNADGSIKTVQNFQIWVEVKPKAGPNVEEQVGAIIAGALAKRKPLPAVIVRGGNADVLQGVVIPDAHIGDLAWGEGTGGTNNDTALGVETLRRGATEVMAQGDERRVGERHFWLLGDYFHHDGKGMTTKGTPLDYDSRVQKMLKLGAEVLFDLIDASASKVPTRVILVPGNHDAVLTWALQRILVSEFRRHKGVTIDDSSTTTKYLTHGKCLIGLDHGDKGKRRLPEVMAAQCAVEWGQTTCRHIHTGHLHGKAKIVTEGGVVVWTHDSLKPSDQWHTDEKFNTSPRTIEAYRYHRGGMFAGSDAWSPDLNAAPRAGTHAGLRRVA